MPGIGFHRKYDNFPKYTRLTEKTDGPLTMSVKEKQAYRNFFVKRGMKAPEEEFRCRRF